MVVPSVVVWSRGDSAPLPGPDWSVRPTLTTISWMPLEPSGNGVGARGGLHLALAVDGRGTASVCWPGSAVQGRYHCRQ